MFRHYMRYITSVLFISLIVLMLSSVAVSATAYKKGDVNKDGYINVRDATVIQKHIASITVLDNLQTSLADYDGDDKVTVKDATAIQKYAAGFVSEDSTHNDGIVLPDDMFE